MSKNSLVRWVVLSAAMVAAYELGSGLALGAESGPIAAHMDTFSTPQGASYFALSMKPSMAAPAAGPRDIVVLFNTSASQMGQYRGRRSRRSGVFWPVSAPAIASA